jgi:hypothetical protein
VRESECDTSVRSCECDTKHLRKKKKIDCECEAPICINISAYHCIRVLGTVRTGSMPSPARLGYQPSAGTSLLENKVGGVRSTTPRGSGSNEETGQVIKTVIKRDCI